MENKFIELLESIGLTKNEVQVYLDLLKNAASTAYEIGKRINQHRSSVYGAIKNLMERGFIVEIQEQNRKLYQTKESTAIEEYLKQKQAELKEVTPYLKEISNTNIPEGSVSISYGPTRLRAILSEIFSSKEEILIWTIPKNIDSLIGEWFLHEINAEVIKQKSKLRIIYSKNIDFSKELEKNQFIEARYLEDEANIFTISCGESVYIVVLGNPLTVIEMKNAHISSGFTSRFCNFWERASKTH